MLAADPDNLIEQLPDHSGPRDGWPVPTLSPDDAVGLVSEDVIELYRSEGFEVEIYHLGTPGMLNSDLRPGRVRMLVDQDRVVDASQG